MKREIWIEENRSVRTVDSKSSIGHNNNMIPLIMRYNQFGNKFMQLWKNVIKDNTLFNDYKLVAAYSRNKNIGNYLVRAKLNNELDDIDKPDAETESNQGFKLCSSTKCLTCKYHATDKEYFRSTNYGSRFNIKQNINCGSKT